MGSRSCQLAFQPLLQPVRVPAFAEPIDVRPHAVERARAWRFHPHQQFEDDGEELLVRFRSGGLFELANHLFGWAGDLVIEGPAALKDTMEQRLAAAQEMLRPKLS